MTPVLALLPSPLLGPSAWAPVARVLEGRGWAVLVGRGSPVTPSSGDAVLAALSDSLPVDAGLVAVPHSNAGAYVPELWVRRRVVASVFVDAVLPPWTHWWEEADVAALFPDQPARATVEAEQQRLPLTYFEGSRPVPAGWEEMPGAYLAFGEGYADEREDAAERGWPVRTLRSAGHLHQLHEPVEVADSLEDLLARIGVDPERS